MEVFVFPNRQTHVAFEFVILREDRLRVLIGGTKSLDSNCLSQLESALEEWLIEERPTSQSSFYDQLLESILYEIDFENLATAVKMWCLENAKAQSNLVEI